MEETTPPERTRSALVVGFSLVSLLVKGGECGELVLPSLPPLVRRTEEREELVCGRVRALTGSRENNPVPAVSVWSEEEEQGGAPFIGLGPMRPYPPQLRTGVRYSFRKPYIYIGTPAMCAHRAYNRGTSG